MKKVMLGIMLFSLCLGLEAMQTFAAARMFVIGSDTGLRCLPLISGNKNQFIIK